MQESFKTTRLTVCAMLSAMCAVLGYVAISTNSIKITFEGLPILVAAFLFGPVSGMLVGGVGTFIYQLLRYGMCLTTPLWIIPYIVMGGMAGYLCRKTGASHGCSDWRKAHTECKVRADHGKPSVHASRSLSTSRSIQIVLLCQLTATLLNTGAIYVDSHIYGYYSPVLITGSLMLRVVICIVKSVAYGALLPALLKHIELIVVRGYEST